jgi:tetratricopeptide (TPR) repeat protein
VSEGKEAQEGSHPPAGWQRYDLAAVRNLLLAAFDAVDFRRLFLYTADDRLRPLVHEFSPGDGLADMVDEAVEFCLTRGLFPALLAQVGRERPQHYADFAPRLLVPAGTQPDTAGDPVTLVLDAQAVEALAHLLVQRAGVDKTVVQRAGAAPDQETARQITEAVAVQKEAAARGIELTAEAAYRFGLLAAYRRDYEQALDYFRHAGQVDPGFSDAFESIAWVEQTLAMDAIQRRAYDAAWDRLQAAREAAAQTDPLDPHALNLRGYLAKTLAQVAEARGDSDERARMYAEAARLFEHIVRLNPDDAGAHNGLGNVLYARGELDAAIEAYRRAIELQPAYAAAHHDLAAAYEGKMRQDPVDRARWCRQALDAWRQVYELAPLDPTFSAGYLLTIGQRIAWLRQQCP